METKRLPIEEATQQQLATFAKVNLGLDVDGRLNADKLRGAIERAVPGIKDIILFDVHSVTATRKARGNRESNAFIKTDANGKERTYCRILIPTVDKPGGEEPVPVSVNGSAMFIPRGEPQDVPIEYVEALENAEELIYAPYSGEGLGGLQAPKLVKRHQFQYA